MKGESELSVRGVFLAAKALTPCVLFLDECDAFAPPREGMASGVAMGSSQGASGASARALGTLMHEMDALGDLVGDAAYAPINSASVHVAPCSLVSHFRYSFYICRGCIILCCIDPGCQL